MLMVHTVENHTSHRSETYHTNGNSSSSTVSSALHQRRCHLPPSHWSTGSNSSSNPTTEVGYIANRSSGSVVSYGSISEMSTLYENELPQHQEQQQKQERARVVDDDDVVVDNTAIASTSSSTTANRANFPYSHPNQHHHHHHQRRNTNTDIASLFFSNPLSNLMTTKKPRHHTNERSTQRPPGSGVIVTSESHHSTQSYIIRNDDDDDDENEYPTLLSVPHSRTTGSGGGDGDSNTRMTWTSRLCCIWNRPFCRRDCSHTTGSSTTPTITNTTIAMGGGAILNLCNATLGAGILALPYTFLQAGIICSLLLLFCAAMATERSIYILITVVQYCQTTNQRDHQPHHGSPTTATRQYDSYESLVEHVLDRTSSSSSSSTTTTTTTRRTYMTISYRRSIEIAMLLFCCGCAIGYIMAIMDILEQFHLLFVHQSRNYTILVVWVVAMVPLSSLQNVQSLQYASAVGIMAIATLIVAALVHYVQHHPHHHQQQNYFRDWNEELSTTDHLTTDTSTVSILLKLLKHWRRPFNTAASTDGHVNDDDVSIMDFLWPINGWVSILTSGPVVLFAFSCQPNVCSIYDELMVDDVDDNNHYQRLHHRSSDLNGEISSHPTTSKKVQLMQRVTVIAVCICATLYCSISVIALADFGNNVQPNMLSCYSNHQNGTGENGDGGSMLIQIATAAMALAIVMAFPLNIFPARVTLIGLWHNYCQQRRQSNSESILSNHNIDRSISLHGIVPHSALTTALLDDDAETDEQLLVATNLDDRNNDGSLGSSLIISPDDTNDNCHVIDGHENGNSTATTTLTNSSDPPFNRTVHIVSTLILTTSTLVLALLLPNISVVFGLLGGTASSWLGFCVPGLLGIQLCKNECANGQPPRSSLLLTSWTLLVGGIIIGILTTGVTIYNMIVH